MISSVIEPLTASVFKTRCSKCNDGKATVWPAKFCLLSQFLWRSVHVNQYVYIYIAGNQSHLMKKQHQSHNAMMKETRYMMTQRLELLSLYWCVKCRYMTHQQGTRLNLHSIRWCAVIIDVQKLTCSIYRWSSQIHDVSHHTQKRQF